jgi:hypothetical protein
MIVWSNAARNMASMIPVKIEWISRASSGAGGGGGGGEEEMGILMIFGDPASGISDDWPLTLGFGDWHFRSLGFSEQQASCRTRSPVLPLS